MSILLDINQKYVTINICYQAKCVWLFPVGTMTEHLHDFMHDKMSCIENLPQSEGLIKTELCVMILFLKGKNRADLQIYRADVPAVEYKSKMQFDWWWTRKANVFMYVNYFYSTLYSMLLPVISPVFVFSVKSNATGQTSEYIHR